MLPLLDRAEEQDFSPTWHGLIALSSVSRRLPSGLVRTPPVCSTIDRAGPPLASPDTMFPPPSNTTYGEVRPAGRRPCVVERGSGGSTRVCPSVRNTAREYSATGPDEAPQVAGVARRPARRDVNYRVSFLRANEPARRDRLVEANPCRRRRQRRTGSARRQPESAASFRLGRVHISTRGVLHTYDGERSSLSMLPQLFFAKDPSAITLFRMPVRAAYGTGAK